MSKIRALIEHTEDCDKFTGKGTCCTCGAQGALDELDQLERIKQALQVLAVYKNYATDSVLRIEFGAQHVSDFAASALESK